jgi:hypothetical protein
MILKNSEKRGANKKIGKNLGALLILGMFVLGFSEGFTRQKDLDDVGDGKECDATREVFKMDKKVLGVF